MTLSESASVQAVLVVASIKNLAMLVAAMVIAGVILEVIRRRFFRR